MGFFSGGGFSFPDTLIAIILFVCALVSVTFNTFIIRHNAKSSRMTPPKFLFTSLAVNDLLTALVIPIYVGVKVLQKEEPIKTVSQVKALSRPATTWEKIHGTIVWVLIYTPCYITGLMTVLRYLVVIKPHFKPSISMLLGVLAVLVVYQIIVCIAQAVGSNALWMWEIKVLFNPSIGVLPEWASFMLLATLAVAIIIVSIILSVLLVRSLHQKTFGELSSRQVYNRRISIKVLILNLGSIIFTIPNLCGPFMSKYRHGDDVALWFYVVPGFFIVSFLPSFLSAYNPVVYLLFSHRAATAIDSRSSVVSR